VLGRARRRRWNHAEAQEIEYVLVYHKSGAEEKKRYGNKNTILLLWIKQKPRLLLDRFPLVAGEAD
jgi:hypothetical protein